MTEGGKVGEGVLIPVRVAVVTVSDTRTIETDKSGSAILELLAEAGHQVVAREIITDNRDTIRALLERWIADAEVDVVIATGGTGITPRDVTPEALAPLVSKPIPGFGEAFRWISFQEIGTSAIHSRAEAALCGDTYVFALPGSTGAVRTALRELLLPQLDVRNKPCNFAELLPRIRREREDS